MIVTMNLASTMPVRGGAENFKQAVKAEGAADVLERHPTIFGRLR